MRCTIVFPCCLLPFAFCLFPNIPNVPHRIYKCYIFPLLPMFPSPHFPPKITKGS
ncbi:hypothetical protein [Moorena sp. SIO4G3]|uniref:hypothetical protein n=1 Tax=Moorena sp. SIO4G3 TaxID=2607821 RepID=UPI001429F690|nr:hypothetical protein [Moorena sp. SIO4G3]NEO76904.1 hypothetical protein [Moorena sp. SIO4G3]